MTTNRIGNGRFGNGRTHYAASDFTDPGEAPKKPAEKAKAKPGPIGEASKPKPQPQSPANAPQRPAGTAPQAPVTATPPSKAAKKPPAPSRTDWATVAKNVAGKIADPIKKLSGVIGSLMSGSPDDPKTTRRLVAATKLRHALEAANAEQSAPPARQPGEAYPMVPAKSAPTPEASADQPAVPDVATPQSVAPVDEPVAIDLEEEDTQQPMEPVGKQLGQFLGDPRSRNRWLEDGDIKAYVRKNQLVRVPGGTKRAFVIGAVEVPEDKQNQGIFKRFLNDAHEENPYDITMIEQVHNEDLESFLKRNDWQKIPGRGENSYYKHVGSPAMTASKQGGPTPMFQVWTRGERYPQLFDTLAGAQQFAENNPAGDPKIVQGDIRSLHDKLAETPRQQKDPNEDPNFELDISDDGDPDKETDRRRGGIAPMAEQPNHPQLERAKAAVMQSAEPHQRPALEMAYNSAAGKPNAEKHFRSAAAVIGRMTPAASAALAEGISGIEFADNADGILPKLMSMSTPKEQEELRNKYSQPQYQGKPVGGIYAHTFDGDPGKRFVVVDGDYEGIPAHEVHSHEFGHAIDGPTEKYSSTPEWYQAWESEIRNKQANHLSDYADQSPKEAWAEFSRLVYGQGVDLKTLRSKWPTATAFWEKNKLIPPQKGWLSKPYQPLAEIFDKTIETGSAHIDTLKPVEPPLSAMADQDAIGFTSNIGEGQPLFRGADQPSEPQERQTYPAPPQTPRAKALTDSILTTATQSLDSSPLDAKFKPVFAKNLKQALGNMPEKALEAIQAKGAKWVFHANPQDIATDLISGRYGAEVTDAAKTMLTKHTLGGAVVTAGDGARHILLDGGSDLHGTEPGSKAPTSHGAEYYAHEITHVLPYNRDKWLKAKAADKNEVSKYAAKTESLREDHAEFGRKMFSGLYDRAALKAEHPARFAYFVEEYGVPDILEKPGNTQGEEVFDGKTILNAHGDHADHAIVGGSPPENAVEAMADSSGDPLSPVSLDRPDREARPRRSPVSPDRADEASNAWSPDAKTGPDQEVRIADIPNRILPQQMRDKFRDLVAGGVKFVDANALRRLGMPDMQIAEVFSTLQHDVPESVLDQFVKTNYTPPSPRMDGWWHKNTDAPKLAASKMVRSEPIDTGNITRGVVKGSFQTPDGGEMVGCYKPTRGEDHTVPRLITPGNLHGRETAAWELCQALGNDLVPVTVTMRPTGEKHSIGSVQEWRDGENAKTAGAAGGFTGFGTKSHQMAFGAAFDFLIGNIDRHKGNVIISPDGTLNLIDHGLSFPKAHNVPLGCNRALLLAAGRMMVPEYAEEWPKSWPRILRSMKRNNMDVDEIARLRERIEMIADAARTGQSFSDLMRSSGIQYY